MLGMYTKKLGKITPAKPDRRSRCLAVIHYGRRKPYKERTGIDSKDLESALLSNRVFERPNRRSSSNLFRRDSLRRTNII